MFKLQQPTGTAQPSYMASKLDLKKVGISYRLVPSSPNSPEIIAANVFIEQHVTVDKEDMVTMSVRGTVFNSTNRPGEIYVTGPSRQYEQTRNGQTQTRRSQDVLFNRDIQAALNKAIHEDLMRMANVPATDAPTAGGDADGEGAGEQLPDDFK